MKEWTSQNGEKKSAPVIIVNQLDFGGNSNQSGSQNFRKPQQQMPQNEPPMDFSDDIPFAPIGLTYLRYAIYMI